MTEERGLVQTELFCSAPRTPIAAELFAHFADGGSVADAIKLVERLERVSARAVAAKRSTVAGARGTRLPNDWIPSEAEVSFALQRGMPPPFVENEIEKFRNYWTAKSGAGATKRDWRATWRNWIITAMERSNGPGRIGGFRPRMFDSSRRTTTGPDAILAGMGRLADRLIERRGATIDQGRQVSHGADVAGEFDS